MKLYLKSGLAAIAVAALLAGCGGNDDDAVAATPTPTRTTDVPTSATQSVAAMLAYLTDLISGSSNTAEPILVGDAVLPTSDTTEPVN